MNEIISSQRKREISDANIQGNFCIFSLKHFPIIQIHIFPLNRCNKVHQLRLETLERKKSRGKYSYQFQNKNAGILAGHRVCTRSLGLVPRNMGWLWNLETEKGWCPGAVRRSVGKIMKQKLCRKEGNPAEADKENPMLKICKKNGEYEVFLNPKSKVAQEECPVVLNIGKETSEKPSNSSCSENEICFEYNPPTAAKNGPKKPVQSNADTQYDQKDYSINDQLKNSVKPSEKMGHSKNKQQNTSSKNTRNINDFGHGYESDNYNNDGDDDQNFYGLEYVEEERPYGRKLQNDKTSKKAITSKFASKNVQRNEETSKKPVTSKVASENVQTTKKTVTNKGASGNVPNSDKTLKQTAPGKIANVQQAQNNPRYVKNQN